jgi:hypothetical protein
MIFHSTEKKSNHVAPAYIVSDHFESYVCSLFLYFYNRLFLELETIISWSQGNSFTVMPELHIVSDHFESYVCSLFLYFYNRLFLELETIISWSQGNSFTVMPELHFDS